MKKRFTTILLILWVCLKVSGQEQLTTIRNTYDIGYYNVFNLNKRIVWTSTEQNGVNLYTSDGTKEGTKLLTNLSTSIPTVPNSFDEWSIAGDELLYRLATGSDKAEMYKNFSLLQFVTNGSDKTIKLFETKDFIEGSSALKVGNDYYYIYGQKDNNVLLLKIFKVYPDSRQELIKIIDLSKEDASIIDVRWIENAGNLYCKVTIAPDFLLSSQRYLIINPVNGEIVNKNQEAYLTSFHGKVFFSKYDESGKKYATYVTSEAGLVKLFESDDETKFFPPLADEEEIIFFDKENWWITDGTIANTKFVKSLYPDLDPGMRKKINNSYLFYDMNFRKWQIYDNGVMKKPGISIVPHIDFDNYPKSFVYENKFYFNALKQVDDKSRLCVYVFDGNDVALAADLSDYERNGPGAAIVMKNGGMLFPITPIASSRDKTLFYWHPTLTDPVVIATGPEIYVYPFETNKVIIAIMDKRGTIYESINFRFYVSDLKSPARLFFPIVFLSEAQIPGQENLRVPDAGVLGDKLYFSAYTPDTGYEPWVTDGTAEGTKMVADLWQGPQSSLPGFFRMVNGIPVCQASTPDLGRQLFSLLPKLDSPVLVVPNTQSCEGDTIVLTASKGFDSYKWIIDDGNEIITTDNKLSITKSGTYKVIVSKNKATSFPSNAVSIHFIPLPAKPSIKQENNQLVVTATGQLQWYFNGTAIVGAITNTLTYAGAGDYTVKVTENTCSVVSDKLLVAITSTEELWEEKIYPNPASHKLIVKTNQQQPVHLELITIEGKTLLQQTLSEAQNEINLKGFNKGVYILKLNQHTRKIIIE
ncbi:T9SS type A sorting domain-containing protein [Emticicia sp. C21]|uniref:T9SS type A sorting domain-containing protein n=1 Tax=Emticicia sp. C21 TaxID=2302915 RepID=UPI000E343856|nr:T9SS type A sorting domain-containing protein [Emticicia sp. C21]RFS18114.1 T9SS C-terminal target domain-containing protein [Emticicia sp. C21]